MSTSSREPGTDGTRPGSQDRAPHRQSLVKLLVSRAALPVWLAFGVALAVAAGSGLFSSSARLANFELPRTAFPDSYLMLSKRDKGRCYLVNRRDSTVRRNRKNLPGRMWWIERFGTATSLEEDHWLLRSKRKSTVLFVPVEEISDWTYPLLYDFVRRQGASELPPAGWTQLFVDRIYEGLYLRVDLPFDQRRNGGGDPRGEILTVRGDGMTLVDTSFDPAGRLYADLASKGIFPRLRPPSPPVVWLASHLADEATYLLNAHEPFDVSLLPLPLSLARQAEKLYGPLTPIRDERHRQWIEAAGSLPAAPFTRTIGEQLEQELDDYKAEFEAALAAHRAFHGGSPDPDRRPPLALDPALAGVQIGGPR